MSCSIMLWLNVVLRDPTFREKPGYEEVILQILSFKLIVHLYRLSGEKKTCIAAIFKPS